MNADGGPSSAAGAVREVETTDGRLTIRSTHPGGNGRVLEVDGDGSGPTVVSLEPETRDSTRRWFYWDVDVECEFAGDLEFRFPNDEVVGPRGPAVRSAMPCGSPTAAGAWEAWRWLGADARLDARGFRYAVEAGERVQFALSFPYQRADFDALVLEVESDPRVRLETLTTTPSGRDVPVLRLGPSGEGTADEPTGNVAIAARHHACESIGSYVLEGVVCGLLESDSLLETHRIHVYPFGDLDGVERGDPGKHRAPHDHNRDYVGRNAVADLEPLYPTTGAVADDLRSLGGLDLALDLHCPYKWGGDVNDRPFLVREPSDASDRLQRLATALETETERDRLTFDASPGTGLAAFDGQSGLLHTFSRFCDLEGADPAVSLEVPYVGTDADPVTPASARRFGRCLARACCRVLEPDRTTRT
ncbi:M14 family zinc carboxypeptidase [Halopiger goleimassiliensis]|uniref:M14 family zinc carboxypeptidase n=1 Tax=Halopiger goleimassiliensis TaxID=1293048 RepID=UPI000677B0C0|nr:M14 family zinc carboxypeptidase [Halopiger goleimassiliensis]